MLLKVSAQMVAGEATYALLSVCSTSAFITQTGSRCGFPGAGGVTHLCLAVELSTDDWDLTDHITTEKISHTVGENKTRHCRKFCCLHKAQPACADPSSQ
jgi:hypothetical protein